MSDKLKKNITTIYEPARKALGLTRDEYALCSYVHYRCADPRQPQRGWCCDKKEEIAYWVGLSRPGLYKMIDRLQKANLLETDAKNGFLCSTVLFIDTQNECKQSLQDGEEPCKQSLQISVNKVDTSCKQSLQISVNKVDVNKEYDYSSKNEGEIQEDINPIYPFNSNSPEVEFLASISTRGAAVEDAEFYEQTPADRIIEDLNHRSASNYRSTTPTTVKIIKARLKEKFTEADFAAVHEYQAYKWLGTEWEEYLRPETLYRPSKFESYLNAANKWIQDGRPQFRQHATNSSSTRPNIPPINDPRRTDNPMFRGIPKRDNQGGG